MSDTLQKMAIALADVENELMRRRHEHNTQPSDEFMSIFDGDDEDLDEDDLDGDFDDEDDDNEDD